MGHQMDWKAIFDMIMPWVAGLLSLLITILLALLAYLFSNVVQGMKDLGNDLKTESKELRDNISNLTSELSELVKEFAVVATRSQADHDEINKLRKSMHDLANVVTEVRLVQERGCRLQGICFSKAQEKSQE